MKFRKIRAIWKLMKGQRLRYGSAIAALVIASCFLYLAPLMAQITIDGVISGERAKASRFVLWAVEVMGGRDYLLDNLWLPCVLLASLTAVAGVFTYLRGRWSAIASESIARNVRDEVYDHLQKLPCKYFDTAQTGDLIQRCTSDLETLRMFLSTQVVEIGRALIMLAVPIPLMLAIDVKMTIASLVMIPVVVGFSLVFFVKVKSAFQDSDEAEGSMTTTIQENLTGIRVVRAFARQDFECIKFKDRNSLHRRLDYRLYILMAWYWASSDLMCLAQKGIVVGAGVYWLALGQLQVGAFYYFLTAVTMFIWPVRMMGRILTDLGKALVAMDRLQEILSEPLESVPDKDKGDAVPVDRLDGAIVFKDVTFGHSSESSVIDKVSFSVKAGETVALLGPSGCGKSTIVNLLLRLYDYDSGQISLDGIELTNLERRFVRSQMSVVMQEPFLYSKSLRDNLKIGRPGAGEDEMIETTSIACMHESIVEFEDGYDTLVGERGVTLSGGQRQRVALARALLQETAIVILDDALSAVDTETETMILDALKQRRGKHTTIVIAHRLSTLLHADQILVMDNGKIIQSGTHYELLAREGLYRRLWEIQTSVDDLDEDEIIDVGIVSEDIGSDTETEGDTDSVLVSKN